MDQFQEQGKKRQDRSFESSEVFLQMKCTRRRYRKTLRRVCLGRQEGKNLNLIGRLAKELEEEWDVIQVKIKIELGFWKISGAKKEHITYL